MESFVMAVTLTGGIACLYPPAVAIVRCEILRELSMEEI